MENIKKVELHLHLDGSIDKRYAEKLLGRDLQKELIAKEKCQDLKEYLEKFNLPISLLSTKENLEEFSYLLTKELEKDNVIYAEIRFCPLFHTGNELTLEEVVESVRKGLRRNSKVKTNLILCMMRNFKEEENRKIVTLAQKYLGKGVVAIDLAGDEETFSNELFQNLFQIANDLKIPFTIHSGEAGSLQNVPLAIEYGAKRIGHGIHIEQSDELMKEVFEREIVLEVCPTSNVETNSVKDYRSHPIRKLYDRGIKVTISTDNRTVSNITLQQEYEKLENYFHFTKEDFQQMNINAINSAFLSAEEKQELLKKLVSEN